MRIGSRVSPYSDTGIECIECFFVLIDPSASKRLEKKRLFVTVASQQFHHGTATVDVEDLGACPPGAA